MERTTSSGVDGRSRDAMRKKKDISALSRRCRRADGGPRTGRNNAHWRASMHRDGAVGLGRLRLRRPFSVSSGLALYLAAHRFYIYNSRACYNTSFHSRPIYELYLNLSMEHLH